MHKTRTADAASNENVSEGISAKSEGTGTKKYNIVREKYPL